MSLVEKFRNLLKSRLTGATGKIPGRVEGKGAAPDVKAAAAKRPLIEQLFGTIPAVSGTPARKLHARKVRRAGVDRNPLKWYRDAHGDWQRFPDHKTAKKARKLGFSGSWRSPSLKPTRALEREHAARVRAGLEQDGNP